MRGLPASGKSTKAKEIVEESGNTIRLNKDLLRTMLHFDKWSGKNEAQTTEAEESLAVQFLAFGTNVVVDDTNLNPKVLNKWKEMVKELDEKFEVVDLTDVPLETCIERDSQRPNPVGRDVIINMARKFGLYKFDRREIICDIDGTLCDISNRLHLIKGNERKDWDAFFAEIPKDEPRLDIIEHVRELSKTHTIVLVTGRPARFKPQTLEWLERYNVPYETIIMRNDNDTREDGIIKKEILDAYFKKDLVDLVIDDRPRVIRMWREWGLKVEDVGKGIEF